MSYRTAPHFESGSDETAAMFIGLIGLNRQLRPEQVFKFRVTEFSI